MLKVKFPIPRIDKEFLKAMLISTEPIFKNNLLLADISSADRCSILLDSYTIQSESLSLAFMLQEVQ